MHEGCDTNAPHTRALEANTRVAAVRKGLDQYLHGHVPSDDVEHLLALVELLVSAAGWAQAGGQRGAGHEAAAHAGAIVLVLHALAADVILGREPLHPATLRRLATLATIGSGLLELDAQPAS